MRKLALALFLAGCSANTDPDPAQAYAGAGGGINPTGDGAGSSSGGSLATGGGPPGGTGGTTIGGNGTSTGGDPCPPAGTACPIMPFGDSITEGVSLTQTGYNGQSGGYRPSLMHLALSDENSISFVGSLMDGPTMVDGVAFPQHHEGHSGYTIDDGCGRSGIAPMAADRITIYQPRIVTLMIGTNDVDTDCDSTNAPGRLGSLMDAIIAADPSLLLVVALIPPTSDDIENVRVQTFNVAVPDLVSERANSGAHILYVDMYQALSSDPSYKTSLLSDKLHPNVAGYEKLGEAWYAAIAPVLK